MWTEYKNMIKMSVRLLYQYPEGWNSNEIYILISWILCITLTYDICTNFKVSTIVEIFRRMNKKKLEIQIYTHLCQLKIYIYIYMYYLQNESNANV